MQLVLLKEKVGKRGPHWKNLYLCFCGVKFETCAYAIKTGNTKSCGCLNIQAIKSRNAARKSIPKSHGHLINNAASKTYVSWRGIIQRTKNPKSPIWFKYGGRGITVCESWLKFESFLKDMGIRPEGTSIDRINNNGNYEPGNCKWSTPKEQAANRRAPPKRKK